MALLQKLLSFPHEKVILKLQILEAHNLLASVKLRFISTNDGAGEINDP